jgi:DNA helicase-2/ATP-dependent DNA helicase PcrA
MFFEKESGDKIKVMRAFSDNEEGKMVAEAIMQDRAKRA